MFRFNRYNAIGIISSVALMVTLIGNYLSKDNKLLNAILVAGMAGQFVAIYNIDKCDNFEFKDVKNIIALDLSLVFCAVCMRIYNIMN